MKIKIDEGTTLEVATHVVPDEDDTLTTLVGFHEASEIMEAWVKSRPVRRAYRYASELDDSDPAAIIPIEWLGDSLAVGEIQPFWDGSKTHHAYPLHELLSELRIRPVGFGPEVARSIQVLSDALEVTTEADSLDRTQMRTRLIFDAFYDDEEGEPGQPIQDCLTDMMHIASERGLAFDSLLTAASTMYRQEIEEWVARARLDSEGERS